MPLLNRLFGRERRKTAEEVVVVRNEPATSGSGFFQNASKPTFNRTVNMIDNSIIDKSTLLVDKSTTVNYVERGKTALEALSQAMTSGADLDSSARSSPPRCYPGTRQTLTTRIQDWILDSQRTWNILWLYGPAGVGKSAVAQTVAEFAEENGCLGATFFFSKSNGCYEPQPVFITLAYQLAVRFPGYLPLVTTQLATDPDLLKKTPRVQFRKLIVEPLKSLSSPPKRLIVLDGLDECKGEQAQLDVIELINNLILSRTSLPIIWMICSRPEPHLTGIFSRPESPIRCWREELAIDTEESKHDTSRFIRARFEEIHQKYRHYVEEDSDGFWPPAEDILCIINEASGLFIFASTILNYVEDLEFGQPNTRLAEVLAVIRHSHTIRGHGPMETLDLLYSRILSEIPSNTWPVTHRLLKVAISQLPATPTNTPQLLSNFLGITRSDFYAALRKLHSVLDVPPPNESSDHSLRFLHASFRDYLVQPLRSGRFCITLPTDFIRNDEVQQTCLRTIMSPACFLAEGLENWSRYKRLAPNVDQLQVDQALYESLTWPSLDPASNRTLAKNLALSACALVFNNYPQFQTSNGHHHELKSMLFTFDFNSFAYLGYAWRSIHQMLPGFICWTKKTSLRDLARTYSSSETDDRLLAHATEVGAEPLDWSNVFAHQSFTKLDKRAYFLLGFNQNAVLVLVDGNKYSRNQYEGVVFHSIKSLPEIWPALAELVAEPGISG